MPYLGNPAQQRFSSPRAASVYSGDGSTTAFTLEEVVSTDEDILVSVDGVIQEPSVAYAVSSGTTLTFTAAPSTNSGNNIFVYYIARTFGSVSMPDGQNVNASTGSFSGALDVKGAAVFNEDSADVDFRVESNNDTHAFFLNGASGKIGLGTSSTDADLHIEPKTGNTNASLLLSNSGRTQYFRIENNESNDTLRFNANDTTQVMNIDSTGAVTKPLQPAFLVRPASTQNNFAVSSEVVVVFGTEVFDRNADFASNTFTAPVTGLYQFNASLRIEGVDSASSYYYIDIRTSNRDYQFIFDPDFGQDNAYFTMVVSCLADMDAGDTADVAILQGSGTQQTDIMIQSHFTGYLVA